MNEIFRKKISFELQTFFIVFQGVYLRKLTTAEKMLVLSKAIYLNTF